jgi:hypothetical protein
VRILQARSCRPGFYESTGCQWQRPCLILVALGALAVSAAGPCAVALSAQSDTPVVAVVGNVHESGTIPHSPGMTVDAALERAGGIKGGILKTLMIVRRGESSDGTPVLLASRATPKTLLMAGDSLLISTYPVLSVAHSARIVVQYLTAGQFDYLEVAYDSSALRSFSESSLRARWQAIQRQSGTFQRQLDVRTERRAQNEVGIVNCEFTVGRVDISVLFNRDGKVLEITMAPVTP